MKLFEDLDKLRNSYSALGARGGLGDMMGLGGSMLTPDQERAMREQNPLKPSVVVWDDNGGMTDDTIAKLEKWGERVGIGGCLIEGECEVITDEPKKLEGIK